MALFQYFFLPYTSTKLKVGYTGFILSLCMFVCPSVLLWTELCLLCIFHNTYFTHITNQLQKVCHLLSFYNDSKIWIFVKFLFTSDCWTHYMTMTYDPTHDDLDLQPTHEHDFRLCIFVIKHVYPRLLCSQIDPVMVMLHYNTVHDMILHSDDKGKRV